MVQPDYRLVRILLAEEIERIVRQSASDGHLLRTGGHAAALASAYPNSGMTLEQLIREIAAAAAKLGIPVEICRPEEAPLLVLSDEQMGAEPAGLQTRAV
jgi:predicted TIM-barrel fold metal-dependent hydrolase